MCRSQRTSYCDVYSKFFFLSLWTVCSPQLGPIYEGGEEGIVLRAQCKKKGLPFPDRVYAMKVLTNYFQSQTATQVHIH